MTNTAISKFILEACECSDEKIGVDEDFYQHFINSKDEELRRFLTTIVKQYSDPFSKISAIYESNINQGKQKIASLVEEMLSLIFIGRMGFNNDGKLVFCNPIGALPTEKIETLLNNRIKNAEPLIYEVLDTALVEDGAMIND
ncbi:hypothetical protein KJ708_01530 [bacterium]|nr:hypothetical protein [bacterium]MBU1917087.1 hypothetical protein [bacterium]